MPIFPESADVKYGYFFLDNIPSSSPYGIKFAPSGDPNQIAIYDNNNNSVFPQGFIDFREVSLDTGAVQAYTGETDGVVTATEPTLAANTTYGFFIVQYDPVSKSWTRSPIEISANTGTGSLTPGTIATLWKEQLNLYATNGTLKVTATSSGAVLTITASAGNPLIILQQPINGVTLAVSTAGVQSLGNPIDLANNEYQQGTPPIGYLSSGQYNLIVFNYYAFAPGSQARTPKQKYKIYLWVDTLATNYSAWETYFLSVAQGTIGGFAVSALKISS